MEIALNSSFPLRWNTKLFWEHTLKLHSQNTAGKEEPLWQNITVAKGVLKGFTSVETRSFL